jgi:hypothetical protein
LVHSPEGTCGQNHPEGVLGARNTDAATVVMFAP